MRKLLISKMKQNLEHFQLSWKLDPIDLTQIDCEAVYDSYQYKFYMYIAIVCGFCFLFFFWLHNSTISDYQFIPWSKQDCNSEILNIAESLLTLNIQKQYTMLLVSAAQIMFPRS